MAAPSISSDNLQNCINLFADDIKKSFTKFEKLEDMLVKLKSEFKIQKSTMKNDLSEIDYIFPEFKGIENFEVDEEYHMGNCRSKFYGVLEKSREATKSLFSEAKNFHSDMKLKIKNIEIMKDDCQIDSQESISKSSNKVNLFILQSRQTEEPFIIMSMKGGSRYKCNGCNQNIPIQSFYLSHIEEYPSGSKTFIPHSYHISMPCLLQRGFEESYLNKTKLNSNEPINKDVICVLQEIGFKKKNMKLKELNDSENDFDNDDYIPDNVSDISNISSNPSIASSNVNASTFIYHRKPQNQKKNILCNGCKLNIDGETYITFEDKIQSLPFHIKKDCLREGRVLLNDFSKTICKVYKLLKTHNELKELIACGFYFNKILGYRPSNPNVKRPFSKSKLGQLKENKDDKPFDCTFIFNEEPFLLERLPHGEKCKGCNTLIRKDDLSLRHKERVPREKLDYSPLISQYYHSTKTCLLDRGFTLKYLSFAKCDANLAGDDNLSRFTEVLLECGFNNENIFYRTRNNNQEIRGFEVASSIMKKPDKEYKLFVDNCTNSFSHCEGCGFILIPKQPCLIYSLTPHQDGNAKMFHIRNTCVKAHFTKEQLAAIPCINNNIIDVSPNEIINCGIMKINTSDQFKISTGSRQNLHNFKPKPKIQKPLSFIVDIVEDNQYFCVSCKDNLILDKYIIKIKDKTPRNAHVHLEYNCVKKLGYSESELARSKLKCNVFLTPRQIEKLKSCGFQNIIKDNNK